VNTFCICSDIRHCGNRNLDTYRKLLFALTLSISCKYQDSW